MKSVGDAPRLGRFAVEFFGCPANQIALVAPLPPDRLFLDQQPVDGREQHRGKADPRRQVEHPPPADAALLAEDFQEHVAIQPREPGRLDAFGVITAIPAGQPTFDLALGQVG